MSKLTCALAGVLSALALMTGSAQAQSEPQVQLYQAAPFIVMQQATAGPRFIVRAIDLYANNETGPDWPGSDEIYAIFTFRGPDQKDDAPAITATAAFDDFDTGERKAFAATRNCLTSVVVSDTDSQGRASAWDCHQNGEAGPLEFTIRLYEEDTFEDDLIGERRVQWSAAELVGGNLAVGASSEESIRLGGYTLRWRVERVS